MFALLDGGAMAALFAATHPERATALVLYEAQPRMSWAPDYDWAMPREEREAYPEWRAGVMGRWLTPAGAVANLGRKRTAPRLVRQAGEVGGQPRQRQPVMMVSAEVDVRAVLPTIKVPTLVLHRTRAA